MSKITQYIAHYLGRLEVFEFDSMAYEKVFAFIYTDKTMERLKPMLEATKTVKKEF